LEVPVTRCRWRNPCSKFQPNTDRSFHNKERILAGAGSLAIETHDLRKEYGAKVAVRQLSLSVPRGSIFGFLGPNGAGKSTSIKMLLGLVRPTSGAARVLDAPAGDVPTRRKIGFLPEHFQFYKWLTPAELLRLHGQLCGMSGSRLEKRIPEMLDLVGLTPHRDKRVGEFSKGMLQRIGLGQALIHDPDLIFLDEPTSGLDPMGRKLVRDIIRAQRERGATVVLNSHLLGEVEITCDNVSFLKDGQIVATHEITTLGAEEVRVAVHARNLSVEAVAGLAQLATSAVMEGEHLSLTALSSDALPEIFRYLAASGAEVYSFVPAKLSLEDVFVRIMGEDRGL
jgi:ABC-2 type transport system ATP-binding protein